MVALWGVTRRGRVERCLTLPAPMGADLLDLAPHRRRRPPQRPTQNKMSGLAFKTSEKRGRRGMPCHRNPPIAIFVFIAPSSAMFANNCKTPVKRESLLAPKQGGRELLALSFNVRRRRSPTSSCMLFVCSWRVLG